MTKNIRTLAISVLVLSLYAVSVFSAYHFWKQKITGYTNKSTQTARKGATLRGAIITDIDHCPGRSPVSSDQLDNFINFSKDSGADFIISLGDNASHRLGGCSKTADMDARFIADYLRTSQIPAHFVLGDHDIASKVTSYKNWLETVRKDSTFYSFDVQDVHIIVLDTVLGGEPMSQPCEEVAQCSAIEKRLADLKQLSFGDYQLKYPGVTLPYKPEKDLLASELEKMTDGIKVTRSSGIRDKGRVSGEELAWLEADINSTAYSRMIIFSDHPLFEFSSGRKAYNVVNGDRVRQMLARSGKEVVAISGEAHLWHEEKQKNIQYYIIDEFRKANGSWVYFTWDEHGFKLEKKTH